MDVAYVILTWVGFEKDGTPFWQEWARATGKQAADDLALATGCGGAGMAYVIAPLAFLLGDNDSLPDDERESLSAKMKNPLGGE